MEQGEPRRGLDGCGPQVAVEPVDQGAQRGKRPGRVERQELARKLLEARRDRVAGSSLSRLASGSAAPGTRRVGLVRRRRPLLAAAHLVPAGRAPVALPERRVGLAVPDELVDQHRPSAGGAAGREPRSDARRRLLSPCGWADSAWTAASKWRMSGGRSTTSASSRVSGADSNV